MQSITVRILSQKEQHREKTHLGFGRTDGVRYVFSTTGFGGRKSYAHLRRQWVQETLPTQIKRGGAISH